MADRVSIAKERYSWAIQRAGLRVEEYTKRHPDVALSEWMDGTKKPTVKQLEKFAKSVNVPFGYLFLDEVPEERVPFPVFRGEAGRVGHFDLNVYDTVNIALQRQGWLETYLVENEMETCRFIGVVDLSTPVSEAVAKLRGVLSLGERWASGMASEEAAVAKMTERLEEAGVFVTYNGVVGNNTQRVLEVSECRGFALVNEVAPYIFVNSRDASTAQLFTLVHEAAHLLLGVSAGHAAADKPCNEREERYCDSVAAEFLVPAAVLPSVLSRGLEFAAHKFRVSRPVIARRAHDLGLMSDVDYRDFWTMYASIPSTPNRKPSRGGDFYRTSVKRVGRLFAVHIDNAVKNRQLSYIEAYRLTGLYGDTYNNFMGKYI